jgi:UPF0755 protein
MKKFTIYLCGILVILTVLALVWLGWAGKPPGRGRELVFTVPQGWGVRQVCEALADSGLVRSSLYTLWRFDRLDPGMSLQAGTYLLSDTMTPDSILLILAEGNVIPVPTHWLTLPPGLNQDMALEQICTDLGIERQVLDSLASEEAFLSELGVPSLEGHLYPETYEFADSLSPGAILARIVDTGESVWTSDWYSGIESSGLSRYETLILASIVEREAAVDAERAIIAGVFLGRLRREMRLESCATVQYALGDVREQLLYRDLEVESPYNTYLHTGLPPGPICSPGYTSLLSAVFPDTTEGYLYFVSMDDGTGSHLFARTHTGHLENRRIVSQ